MEAMKVVFLFLRSLPKPGLFMNNRFAGLDD